MNCSESGSGGPVVTRDCTGDVTLPSTLAGRQGLWYVRAEAPGDPKRFTNSNTLEFTWTVPLPDLALNDLGILVIGDFVDVSANVVNPTGISVSNVVVEIDVTLTPDTGPPIRPTIPDQIVSLVPSGTSNNPGQAAVGYRIPDTVIGGVARPFDLRVEFTVDPSNAIPESDESNNVGVDSRRVF